jgi:hypothetical protein
MLKYIKLLCQYETWFLILREEHRQRVFEKRVLKRTWGTNRYKLFVGWTCTTLHTLFER